MNTLQITAIRCSFSQYTTRRSLGSRLGYKREPECVSNTTLKVIAVGGKAFVTGFVLSGVLGSYASSSSEALGQVERLLNDPEVGLIMVSSEIAKPIRADLTSIRAKRAIPLIYEVPGPGGEHEKVEYRSMLRQILGV
ncbi:MAG: vacuolar H+transporting two-sector ATPase F subunit [Thaumarchaeota archaeon]|nr:MAG: vacuolar H+transporting two-sector ATPase F subunit [Nitrososphaerota archaeon]